MSSEEAVAAFNGAMTQAIASAWQHAFDALLEQSGASSKLRPGDATAAYALLPDPPTSMDAPNAEASGWHFANFIFREVSQCVTKWTATEE